MTTPSASQPTPREVACERCELVREGDSVIVTFGDPAAGPGDAAMAPTLRVALSVEVATQLRDVLVRSIGQPPAMPRLE